MEFANLWSKGTSHSPSIRAATRSDTAGIMALLRTAKYQQIHVDWYLPGDWIGIPGFVVVPNQEESSSFSAKLLGARQSFHACLAVAPDPTPASWVRVVALDDHVSPLQTLGEMMVIAAHNLRKTAVSSIALLAIQEWPSQYLPQIGFKKVNEIETYVKDNTPLPPMRDIPDFTIRPVLDADFKHLERLEEKAFDPLWRHSARGLKLAHHQAFSFDVALLQKKIVGFQLSTPSNYGVHLVRLTVDPDTHGLGIGSAILNYAFQNYQRRGRHHITLNTQVDNKASQRLYRKFGFHASGQRYPVWLRQL